MATLIGESKEEATNLACLGKEIAVQFECTVEGTLEELHVIPSKNWSAAEAFLGIAEENAGVPGTVLASKGGAESPKEKVAYALSGFSVKLKKGTKYWLIAKSGTGANTCFILSKSGGSSTVRKSTKTFTKIETTSEWEAAIANGPLSFWGTGKEEGGGLAGTAKISFKDSATALETYAAAGTTKVRFQNSAAALQTLAAGGTAQIRLADSATILTALAAAGTTKVRFATAAEVTASSALKVIGSSAVKFKSSANPAVQLAAAGTSKVSFKGALTPSALVALTAPGAISFKDAAALLNAVSASGASQVRFSQHLKVLVTKEGGTKKVVLMIFED